MKSLLLRLLLAVLVAGVAGCGRSETVSKGEFTREYVAAVRAAAPGLKLEVVRLLEVKATAPDGHESTAYLDNAYDEYRQAPASKAAIFARHAQTLAAAATPLPDKVDRTRIVPVVKDRGWIAESRQAMKDRGAKNGDEVFFETLGPDVVVMYAEDRPTSIRYLSAKDLDQAEVSRAELRALACDNLKRLLPSPNRHGADGFYMMTLDGTFEASLLLYPKIWTPEQMPVKGEVVVAIPNRDMLIATGSEDAAGLEKMRALVEKSWQTGSYRLTRKLFVFRGDHLEEFASPP
ncbi:MAG TPA: DUF1444 family protein [Opitutaceae bacterium]|nr:DUF1444 family protein [Opitutaceae bacterium]